MTKRLSVQNGQKSHGMELGIKIGLGLTNGIEVKKEMLEIPLRSPTRIDFALVSILF